MLESAKEIRKQREVDKRKEAERDVDFTRQYAAQLDKADRERNAAMSKIKQFMGGIANAFESQVVEKETEKRKITD